MRWALVVVAICACSEPPYEFDDARAPCPALGNTCDPTPGDQPAISTPRVVAPSDQLPPEVISQKAHNNLDVIWFRGRLYFAFRTAPYHFADDKVVMYVVSTADHEHWTFETSIEIKTDVREPRFLALGDRLVLYFAVLGDYLAEFTPKEARVIEMRGPGDWSESRVVTSDEHDMTGYIPWRAKLIDGVPSVIGYVGGEAIYQPGGEGVKVSWSTLAEPDHLTPRFPQQPIVLEGGSSETDLVTLDEGTVIAVSRNELGDDLGWGSKICRAEPGAQETWSCVGDPRKYDSPFLFRHGAEVYLIGRRQVANDGLYDLGLRELTAEEQTMAYELEYWQTPKRCALWKVDPDALAVAHVLDLPSAGDTCFAGMVELGGGRYLIYDYTSPLDGDLEQSWMNAQFGPTQIHAMTLTLP